MCNCVTVKNEANRLIACLLRWVKVSSECIVRDTEVSVGIAIIRGRFVTIYGD